MARMAAILAAVAVLIYMAILGARWLQPRMEADIAGRVTTTLASQGLLFADVAISGRDVVLTGEAPSAEARDAAVTAAVRVLGVASVSNALIVVTPSTVMPKTVKNYQLTVQKEGNLVTLTGAVPDSATATVLHRIAMLHYDAANVSDTLTVTAGAPAGWRSAAGSVLMHMANLEKGSVTLSGTEVMLQGEVLTEEFKANLQSAISSSLPSAYKVAMAIDVVTPEANVTITGVSPTEAVSDDAATTNIDSAPNATATTISHAAGPSAQGCQLADVTKEKVMFGFDKTDVAADQLPTIGRVAGTMQACVDEPITVQGYTDATGSQLYNKWLSEQRAQATQRALIKEGITANRLHAVGMGEANPVAPNTTKAGRAANRRVEFAPGIHTAPKAAPKPMATKAKAKPAKQTKQDKIAKPNPMVKPTVEDAKAIINSDVEVITMAPATTSKTDSTDTFWSSMDNWLFRGTTPSPTQPTSPTGDL